MAGPLRSLPAVGRDELPVLRLLARRCPRGLAGAVEELAGELVGSTIGIASTAPPDVIAPGQPAPSSPTALPTVAVLLTPPEGPPAGARAEAAVELGPELAAALVHRVLGGDGLPATGGEVEAPVPPVPPGAVRGALLYAAARLVMAAGDGGTSPFRVSGVVQGRPTVVHALRGDPPLPVGIQPWRVRLGGRLAGLAWTWWRLAPSGPGDAVAPISPADWRRVDALTPAVRVEAARVPLALRELRALAPGDVLLPPELRCGVYAGGTVQGVVGLRLPGEPRPRIEARVDEQGVRVQVPWSPAPGAPIGEGRRIGRMEDDPDTAPQPSNGGGRPGGEPRDRGHAPRGEAPTSTGTTAPTRPGTADLGHPGPELLDAAAEAPVEVAVELGRFRLPLGELLAARPGEVLATGLIVSGDVRLTVGDRTVGIGELVDVDGTLGVRLIRVAPDPGGEGYGR